MTVAWRWHGSGVAVLPCSLLGAQALLGTTRPEVFWGVLGGKRDAEGGSGSTPDPGRCWGCDLGCLALRAPCWVSIPLQPPSAMPAASQTVYFSHSGWSIRAEAAWAGGGRQPVPPVCVTRVWCHPSGSAASGVKYELLRVPGHSWRSLSCSLAPFPLRGRSAGAGADPSAGCGQPRRPEDSQTDLGRTGWPRGRGAQPQPGSALGRLREKHHPRVPSAWLRDAASSPAGWFSSQPLRLSCS